MKNKLKIKFNKKTSIFLLAIIAVVAGIASNIFLNKSNQNYYNTEIEKSKTYKEVEKGEEKTNCEYVDFDAFFLRDLDGDGYAESIRGTCKKVGDESHFYMNLNVNTNGVLKDGKITINSDNFYLDTSIPKDAQIKENVIGTNIKEIKLNDITNGTQKLIEGSVKSGDYTNISRQVNAIGNDTSKYSKINSVTLTGTHIADDGTETKVEKKVEFNVDWYGTAETDLPRYWGYNYNFDYKNQIKNIDEIFDEENQEINLEFEILTRETKNELILSKSEIETEIPQINGYSPKKVEVLGDKINYTYDEETRKLIAKKEAVLNENGVVIENAYTDVYYGNSSKYDKLNLFRIKVTYSLEAYQSMGTDTVELKMPVSAYYEGYNNSSTEFKNPYKSSAAKDTIIVTYRKLNGENARFDITVGKCIYDPSYRYIVSKQKPLKIYNDISAEENDDTYIVRWYGTTGDEESNGMIMKEQSSDQFVKQDSTEESMENVTTNIGIYFSNPVNLLGEDGFIKVYNAETNELLETFTKDNWNKYNPNNLYKYNMPVKHIRIETSKTNANASIDIYNIKKLDDTYITENYTKEEFEGLKYIKSSFEGYLGENPINTASSFANYEESYSIAKVNLSKTSISTQETEKNIEIKIDAVGDENKNQEKWLNGIFLLKLPKDIVDIEINSVLCNNSEVEITSYELYEEDGINYIKIITSNTKPATYKITVDCDITPDPRIATTSENIEIYASNENCSNYYYSSNDIYDVNGNFNTEEKVNISTTSLDLVSPSSLLTNQLAKNYDENGSEVIAPKVALVSKNQRTATVELEIRNNYSNTISDVQILGKIPSEGNTYTISKNDLGSNYSSKMSEKGIRIPEELKEYVTVYYSEKENPSKDISDKDNLWTKEPDDWKKVKSYLINLDEYVIPKDVSHKFSYEIEIPENLNYNQIAYSHHGVYFCLNTEEGKYETQTEPTKLGFMIAKQFNVEISKYQKNTDKQVPGATYAIIEENSQEGKSKVTDKEGKILVKNLYVEKTYVIKEIKSPLEYDLNEDEIKFTTKINKSGDLEAELVSGTLKSGTNLTVNQTEEGYTVSVQVEDEVKPRLRIIKTEKGTENRIKGVCFKITGEGLPEEGRLITTNSSGEAALNGLSVGVEYTLEEIRAEGYYLGSPIKFMISNTLGTYSVNLVEGEVKSQGITEVDNIPTANIEIENSKIPTYNLQINKVVKGDGTPLLGAKFRLFKGTQKIGEYITDAEGHITIENLYLYEEEKGIEQTYTLKEIIAPEGYVPVKDITFKVQKVDGTLEFQEELSAGILKKLYTVEGNTVIVTIEDSPSFKLIKKDGETGEILPGTKFAIYNVDDGTEKLALDSKYNILGTKETINGKDYYTLTTNEKGEITADLREGLYKAIEVKASDEKYEITNNSYYFGIGATREAKTTMSATGAAVVGGTSSDNIYSIISTNDGGYVAGGYFCGTIQVGEYTLTSKGDPDGMIIKYSASGEVEWAKSYGGTSADYIKSMSLTNDGGILAGGYFHSGTVQVEEYTVKSNGYYDGIIIKYNFKGEVEWTKSFGGASNDYITSILSTNDGGIVVGGYFSGTIRIEGYTLTCKGGGYDGLIIKCDNAGKVEWAKSIGETGTYHTQINSLSLTKDGGYIAVGYFQCSVQKTTLQVGEYTLTNKGKNDGLIIKYNSAGEVEWAKSVGGTNNDTIISAIGTEDGGILAVGGFYGTIQIGDYTLKSKGNSDGILIKYSASGEVEWTNSIGGSNNEYIESVIKTEDGEIIAGGTFYGTIQVGKYKLTSKGDKDGMIIKCTADGEVEWATSIKGKSQEQINTIAATKNGEILAGVFFNSAEIQVGDYTLKSNGMFDGLIAKFGKKEIANPVTISATSFERSSDDEINLVAKTKDGGYVEGGEFSGTLQVGDYTLVSNGRQDVMITKYTADGEVEWAKSVGGTNNDYITSVMELDDGTIVAKGYFQSPTIETDGQIITNSGTEEGMILKIVNLVGIPEVQELTVENKVKELKITTDIKEIDGIKGGSISGEDMNPYEKVKYGNSSANEIVIIPEENYEILQITVNGKHYQFEALDDGRYVMPQFTDVTEDKHIEVTFIFSDNKLVINKIDSETGEGLENAVFELTPVLTQQDLLDKNLVDMILPEEYEKIYTVTYVDGVVEKVVFPDQGYEGLKHGDATPEFVKGPPTRPGYIFKGWNPEVSEIVTKDVVYVAQWEEETYIVTYTDGVYGKVVFPDRGYEGLKFGDATPAFYDPTIREGYIFVGWKPEVTETVIGDVTYVAQWEEESTYTVKNTDVADEENILAEDENIVITNNLANDDNVIGNSITNEQANNVDSEISSLSLTSSLSTQLSEYQFIKSEDGTYKSNNQGIAGSRAFSYIPLDLKNYPGEYELELNARVSSEMNFDYGYALITENPIEEINTNDESNAFMRISGNDGGIYKETLKGGKTYNLIFGYYKDGSVDGGDDTLTIDSVRLVPKAIEPYKLETNYNGQAIGNIPFGKYEITEIKAPDGYILNEESLEIDFAPDSEHIVTILNTKLSKVIVHYYLKDENATEIKLKEDDLLEGKMGEKYTTSPPIMLVKDGVEYELEKDSDNKYVTPSNATGEYKTELQEVIYYYQKKIVKPETIDITVNKVWDDMENVKSKRPNSINIAISKFERNLQEYIVVQNYELKVGEGENSYTFTDLLKYDETGNEIKYIVTESEVNEGELSQYISNVNGYKITNKLIIKGTEIEKTGTETISLRDEIINYLITYKVDLDDSYEDENIKIKIVDNLPYRIDISKPYSLAGGEYNPDSKTINWTGIYNTQNKIITWDNGEVTQTLENSFEISKEISLAYEDIGISDELVTNSVSGNIELSNGATEEVTNQADTAINIEYGSIKIIKVDSKDNTIKLDGAEFKLEKLNEDLVVDKRYETLVKETSSGEVIFNDIECGKYRLTETRAPDGYNMLKNYIDIEINSSNPDYIGEISNIAKSQLPATGGNGMVVITIMGIALIVLSIKLKKKGQKKI